MFGTLYVLKHSLRLLVYEIKCPNLHPDRRHQYRLPNRDRRGLLPMGGKHLSQNGE